MIKFCPIILITGWVDIFLQLLYSHRLCRVFVLLWWGSIRDLLKVTEAHILLWTSRTMYFWGFITGWSCRKVQIGHTFQRPEGRSKMHLWYMTLRSVPLALTLSSKNMVLSHSLSPKKNWRKWKKKWRKKKWKNLSILYLWKQLEAIWQS